VNAEEPVTKPASGFVKVRFRAEIVAVGARLTLTVSKVALLKVTLFTVIPVPLNEADTPFTNPVPVIARF
jgi:hypothetical protein